MFLPGMAQASPWTQAQGTVALRIDYIFQAATSQFNVEGRNEVYLLNGFQIAQDIGLGVRYGLAEGVEIEFGTAFKRVEYRADLLCKDETPGTVVTSVADYACPQSPGENPYGDLRVIDVDADIQGVADIYGQFKVRLLSGPILLTVAPYAKVPTGYDAPGGLYTSATDDVALGDGQVDLGGFVYLGRAIVPWKTFVRLDLGYLHRFGAPGDQVVGRFRIGYQVHARVLVAMGAQIEKTVTPGEVIGNQGLRILPDGTIVNEPVESERDTYTADMALILRVSDTTELMGSAFKILGGRYVASSSGFTFGVVKHF